MRGEATTATPGVVSGPVKWAGVGALVTLALGATVMAFLSRTPGQIGTGASEPAKSVLVASAPESTSVQAASTAVMDEPQPRPPVVTPLTVPVVMDQPFGPPAPVAPLAVESTPATLAPSHPPKQPAATATRPSVDPKAEGPRPVPSQAVSPSVVPTKPSSPAAPASLARLININTASQSELELLPRIGPAVATRIVEYREQHGPFRRAEDLDRVKGIGPKTLEKLLPLVTTGE